MSFGVAYQNCNIIGQSGKSMDTVGTFSLPQHPERAGDRKRSRPQVFSANVRLCFWALLGQLILFFSPLCPQTTARMSLGVPAEVTVPIFAAHCCLPVLYPPDQSPGTQGPVLGIVLQKPCSWSPPLPTLYPCSTF